jgi:hypothetical protein
MSREAPRTLAEMTRARDGWKARAEAREAEVERLREGLLACATAAGEDVSDGIPTCPDVVDWAVRAVAECRAENEAEIDRLEAEIDRLDQAQVA